jgi:hypothetical protein
MMPVIKVKKRFRRLAGLAATAIVSIALLFCAAIGILRFNDSVRVRQLDSIRSSVQKAVIHCYSLEGSYPSNLEYLQQNYGLILDKSHYVYDYRIFAANVSPDIFIFRKT